MPISRTAPQDGDGGAFAVDPSHDDVWAATPAVAAFLMLDEFSGTDIDRLPGGMRLFFAVYAQRGFTPDQAIDRLWERHGPALMAIARQRGFLPAYELPLDEQTAAARAAAAQWRSEWIAAHGRN